MKTRIPSDETWKAFYDYFVKKFNRQPSLSINDDVALWQSFVAGAKSTAVKTEAPKPFVTNHPEGAD